MYREFRIALSICQLDYFRQEIRHEICLKEILIAFLSSRVSSSRSSKETRRTHCSSSDAPFAFWTMRIELASLIAASQKSSRKPLVPPIYTSESGKLWIEKPIKSFSRKIEVFRGKTV